MVLNVDRIQAMQADVAELQKFADRYTAAWCSQAAATVAAFYSPRGSLRVNDGAPAVGRSAITQTAQSFMTAFPDLRVVMDDLRVQNDRMEYHWTLTGTNTGPGGTGRPVRISGFENCRRSGRICPNCRSFSSSRCRRGDLRLPGCPSLTRNFPSRG
jgi:SnoaL-like polyketide cyclase